MHSQEANDLEVTKFLKSFDFMRLGQAVNKGQWQSAAMTVQRVSKTAKALGLDIFERPLTGLRQAINRKDDVGAKQALSIVISKRVMLLKKGEQHGEF
ncbi:MAG: hypothetical protein E7258_05100 [Lachnospiraceae bacterium]|nr:hypothetical protein [Lachnospiraceae bacterium]